MMIRNYLKTAIRNIKSNKGFFVLNFTGLFVSVVVCILIELIISHEENFDKTDKEGLNIYRVVKEYSTSSGTANEPVTQYPLAAAMRVQMKEEKLISQIHFHRDGIVSFADKKMKEKNIIFADSVFPNLFHLKVKKGSLKNALTQPGFAVLTETTAKKYFGNEEAVGKRLKIENLLEVEIAAVVEDAPNNSHLPYNMLVSFSSLNADFINGIPIDNWGINISGFTYIELKDKRSAKQVETSLASIAEKNLNSRKDGSITKFILQPISDIHYNQVYAEENPGYTINYQYLYMIGAIGLFLILAACINYTNLSTAMAIKKSKEVGIRKTMGANRAQLIGQFLTETFLLTAFTIIAGAIAARLLLPSLNFFLEKNISLDLLNVQTVLFLFVLWLVISILSGIYPAIILSEFNPIGALKNKISNPKKSSVFLRKGLVIFQFITAQILIISSLVVYKQMNFIHTKPLGFKKERVIDVALPENKPEQISSFKNKLQSIPNVTNISISLGAPVSDNGFHSEFNLKEKFSEEKLSVEVKVADMGYLDAYGLKLLEGRWFDNNDEQKTDNSIPDSLRQYSIVINETALSSMGFNSAQQAIGKIITVGINNISAPIIGVVENFHTASLHETVSPVVLMNFAEFYYNAGIKLSPNYSESTLISIEKAWSSVYPNYIFETNFLDEHVASLYKTEARNQKLFNLFTLLSILINALGLIGLLSFMVEQKRKEIGIRKVLGASVGNISFILSKDFLNLIVIAFFIAAPIGWLLMSHWLQDFSYRTEVSWWVFVLAALAASLVACLAVSFQTIKAAIENPIKSLRTE